jgi:hypothetical protein
MSYFLALLLSLAGIGPSDTPGGILSSASAPAPAPVVATIGNPVA